VYPEDYEGGRLNILLEGTTGSVKRNILKVERCFQAFQGTDVSFQNRNQAWIAYTDQLIYTVPSLDRRIVKAYLLSKEDIEYNSNELNGRKAILRTRVNANEDYDARTFTPWVEGDRPKDLTGTDWAHPASDEVITRYKGITPFEQ
jgi:hypothetical protein